MENNVFDISIISMVTLYCLSGGLFIIYHILRIGLQKDFLISIIRMSLQLFAAGYLLKVIFAVNSFYIVFLTFVIMSVFASNIVLKKSNIKIHNIKYHMFASIFIISFILSAFFQIFISKVTPWYDSRYFITIAGMILGNSMNACSLALERFYSEVTNGVKTIETYLTFGATPYEAVFPAIKKSIRSSMLPIITNMSGVGIVFLPGMMTGQILSGENPMIAVKYQIAIMITIASSVTLISLVNLYFFYKTLFNKKEQIIYTGNQK